MERSDIGMERSDIPLGYTRDAAGRVLTYRDSEGFWYEYTRDKDGNVLIYRRSEGFWYEYTRDEEGRVLTYRDSEGYWYEYTRDEEGFWYEYTRDEAGDVLIYRRSDGYWEEYTYDEAGRELSYRDWDGADWTAIAHDLKYTLWLTQDGLYLAGCRGPWTAERALQHWGSRSYARAVLFTEAIRKREGA